MALDKSLEKTLREDASVKARFALARKYECELSGETQAIRRKDPDKRVREAMGDDDY